MVQYCSYYCYEKSYEEGLVCGAGSVCRTLICGAGSVCRNLVCGAGSVCRTLVCGAVSICRTLVCGAGSVCRTLVLSLMYRHTFTRRITVILYNDNSDSTVFLRSPGAMFTVCAHHQYPRGTRIYYWYQHHHHPTITHIHLILNSILILISVHWRV
jgi:hypothetical protein